MNRTLLGLLVAAVAVGATAAHADDFRGPRGHRAAPVARHAGSYQATAPAAQGQYQLQSVQRWVPGQAQQVWVAGSCRGHQGHHGRRGHGGRQCTPGHYEWVTGPGHYQVVQEWVWVPLAPRYTTTASAGGSGCASATVSFEYAGY